MSAALWQCAWCRQTPEDDTPKRVDANQPGIVRMLRQAGATVQCLHEVGKGCPDLLVGFRGENYLLEVKMPRCCLTPDEAKWHDEWRGDVVRVDDAEEALRAIGAIE